MSHFFLVFITNTTSSCDVESHTYNDNWQPKSDLLPILQFWLYGIVDLISYLVEHEYSRSAFIPSKFAYRVQRTKLESKEYMC